ncbi:MAG TPA: hypothetical protein VHM19_13920, partial [Polyangiales bacterium]|nr:hypothetical protein [Polyangiales bacterium]
MVAPAGQAHSEPRQKLKLSNYLGTLEVDPDDAKALDEIRVIVATNDRDRLGDDPVRLLEMARQGHEMRGELATVAKLIEAELGLVGEDRALAGSLWKELGRLRADFLLDADSALEAYAKALEYKADDAEVLEAQKRLEQAE